VAWYSPCNPAEQWPAVERPWLRPPMEGLAAGGVVARLGGQAPKSLENEQRPSRAGAQRSGPAGPLVLQPSCASPVLSQSARTNSLSTHCAVFFLRIGSRLLLRGWVRLRALTFPRPSITSLAASCPRRRLTSRACCLPIRPGILGSLEFQYHDELPDATSGPELTTILVRDQLQRCPGGQLPGILQSHRAEVELRRTRFLEGLIRVSRKCTRAA
jgi:hypothetical protein